MKFLEIIVKNFHWLIILNTAWGYWTRLEEHNLALAQVQEQKPGIEEKIKVTNKKNDEAKIFLANLEVSKKRVMEVAAQIEQVQRQLPSSTNDTEILDFFSSEAKQLNINAGLNPASEETRDFYIAKKYNIDAKGTFLQFLIYFERISSSERLINVQSVKITPLSEKQKGRFQMLTMNAVVESFRYNTSYREDTGLEQIEEQFKPAAGAGRKKRKKDAGDE
ncbi:MAG: type 4a pilus biogenesis protein PilO [Bacteriovoracaceae bacterium]